MLGLQAEDIQLLDELRQKRAVEITASQQSETMSLQPKLTTDRILQEQKEERERRLGLKK